MQIDQEHFVYRHLRSDGAVLYIGCTCNVENRTKVHRGNAMWFGLVDRITEEAHPDRLTALKQEAYAIYCERPIFNKMGNPRYQKRPAQSAPMTHSVAPAVKTLAQIWDELVEEYGEETLIADLEKMDILKKERDDD